MVVGEAPGRQEDEVGRCFVGQAGKLLRSELYRIKLPPTRVYLTNVVKCFPHGTPKEADANRCSFLYLKREKDVLSPHLILTLGRVATNAFIPCDYLGELRGTINYLVDQTVIFPVWHPAFILRSKGKKKEWQNDLDNFAALVKVELGIK